MEAFEPLLKFIFWIGIIYFAFKLSAKYLAPWLVKRFIQKTQEKFFGQNPHLRTDPEPENEGEVTIKPTNQDHTQQKDNLGEFVDFEEVPETKEP